MITIVQASGAALSVNMSLSDFQSLISAAAPSTWVQVTEVAQGPINLNLENVAYYYGA